MVIETIIFALSIASVASTETTSKGLADHAISASKDQDCKMSRSFKGEDVCQPNATVTVSASPKGPVPPINPENPPPKKIIVVNNSISDAEAVFSQRKNAK
jgi:hypothetical protein